RRASVGTLRSTSHATRPARVAAPGTAAETEGASSSRAREYASMMLYVVRHAIAEDTAPSGGDAARRLTSEGRRKMEQVARGLRALGIEPDVILTSPLVRAVETTRIVVAAL